MDWASWFNGNLTEIVSTCVVGLCSLITLIFELINKRILNKIHKGCVIVKNLDQYYIIVDNEKIYLDKLIGDCTIYKEDGTEVKDDK